MKDIVIIGAGLTGLTVAYLLNKAGKDITVLEKESKVGGAIQTHNEGGYIFEEGPNTGVVSNPEVTELFEMLDSNIEIANDSAERRLILKNNKWYPLPNGPISFLRTPLFTKTDKIRIFFEPLKKKGIDPDESVASLTNRRIGRSFVDYAVNPFISGIYAGDPSKLITRHALPKLYKLEQNYGSFIGGAFKKGRESKTERDKKATKKVFSVKGGLGKLIQTLEESIGQNKIRCSTENVLIKKTADFHYSVSYIQNGNEYEIIAKNVVTTSGAYTLPSLLSFIKHEDIKMISELNYAKIVQVSVALKEKSLNDKYISFGGLIPKKENRNLLGVLFPSYCFTNRSPQQCSMLAIYLGGTRRPELYDLSDVDIISLVKSELFELFEIQANNIKFIKIFRHPYAIPQYEISSEKRFETIQKIEYENPGLIIAGNLRDGIGMADRIKQAFMVAAQIIEKT